MTPTYDVIIRDFLTKWRVPNAGKFFKMCSVSQICFKIKALLSCSYHSIAYVYNNANIINKNFTFQRILCGTIFLLVLIFLERVNRFIFHDLTSRYCTTVIFYYDVIQRFHNVCEVGRSIRGGDRVAETGT